ncbi:MAG: protease modulator HflK [Pseudomonadota bacterium]
MTNDKQPPDGRFDGHLQVTGLLVPALVGVSVALLGVAGWVLKAPVVLAVGVHWLFVLVLLVGTRRSLSLARRAPPPSSDAAPARRAVSLPLLRLLGSLAVAGVAAWLWRWPPVSVAITSGPAFGLAAWLLALAFGAVVLARYYQATAPEALPDARGLAAAARVGAWLSALTAASLLARGLGRPLAEPATILVLLALPVAFSLELFIGGLLTVGRRFAEPRPFGADVVSTRVLGSSFNLVQSVFSAVESTFGVDVRTSWALTFLRHAALPVLAGLALLTWLLTSVAVVDESQLAVRERFGRVTPGHVVGPGLYVGLPWPLDRMRRVDVQRVREMPIGYLQAQAGADALWTKFHAAEEYNLLLGDGRDLVTVNAELHYKVSDLHAWLYGCQNPAAALDVLAYRVLMDFTVDRSLDQVLSEGLMDLSERVAAELQRESDTHGLGVEVVAFTLRGLHPPVAVAADYQAVVASQIDTVTYVMEAQGYREGALPKAEADAVRTTRKVEAEAATRLAQARGEAVAFHTIEAEYRASPELYRFRRRLETIESVLPDNPHTILDARIERDGGALWVIE